MLQCYHINSGGYRPAHWHGNGIRATLQGSVKDLSSAEVTNAHVQLLSIEVRSVDIEGVPVQGVRVQVNAGQQSVAVNAKALRHADGEAVARNAVGITRIDGKGVGIVTHCKRHTVARKMVVKVKNVIFQTCNRHL